HAAEDRGAAVASGIGGLQSAADFGDEIGRQRDRYLRIQSGKRQFRMFYANARQNRPLRQGGKPLGLKTELEARICKLNGPWASLNQDLKRKHQVANVPRATSLFIAAIPSPGRFNTDLANWIWIAGAVLMGVFCLVRS